MRNSDSYTTITLAYFDWVMTMMTEKNIEQNRSLIETLIVTREVMQGEALRPEKSVEVEEINHEERIKTFKSIAVEKPFYRENPDKMELLLKEIHPALKNVKKFYDVLWKTTSENVDSARGFFAELETALEAYKAEFKVLELDKTIYSEDGRRTDLDILLETPAGKHIAIENKDCKSGISKTQDFMREIDILSQDFYDSNGKLISINAAVFINNGSISENAMQYAKERNVHIKENMDGPAKLEYLKNLANMVDSK